MKALLTLLIIALACAVAGYFYWIHTPQYAVMKVAESIADHDGETFRTYFDVESVAHFAVEDLSNEQIRAIGGAGLLQRFAGMTITGIFKPELASMLAKNITDYVEKVPKKEGHQSPEHSPEQIQVAKSTPALPGSEPQAAQKKEGFLGRAVKGLVTTIVDTIKPPSLRDVLHELGLSKENFKGLSGFEITGSICHVGMIFQEQKKPQVIVELELENTDNRWRIVRFSNLDTLVRTVSGI